MQIRQLTGVTVKNIYFFQQRENMWLLPCAHFRIEISVLLFPSIQIEKWPNFFLSNMQVLFHCVIKICLSGNVIFWCFLLLKFQLSLRGVQMSFEWFGHFFVFVSFFPIRGNNIIAIDIDPSILPTFPQKIHPQVWTFLHAS